MRRRGRAAAACLLAVAAACTGGDEGTVATTVAPSTTSSTTVAPSTSPPTTVVTTTTFPDCAVQPALASPDPQRPRYSVHADVDPGAGTASGTLTVQFTPDLPVDDLVFRLWANGPTPAGAGVSLTAGPVTRADGAALSAVLVDPTTLDVALGEVLDAGETVGVSMPWSLTVPGSANDRVSHDGDSLRLGSFLPVLAWEPGVGWSREAPTALFAEAASSPAADWDLEIVTPPGYDVLATGVPDGAGHWRATGVRDVGLSAGHFALVSQTVALPDPVTVTVGVDSQVAESPDAYLARVVGALEEYAVRLGPYPWPAYTLAITDGLSGGIEFPMHVMQGPGTVGRTTPHEVGHQWFYSLVGNNQGRDPWLDEGLASYAEFTHEGSLADAQARQIPAAARGQAGQPMTFWESQPDNYYRGVYVQGAVAVASLGPQDGVDCALRRYVAANAFRIADPGDFLAAVSSVFPDAANQLAPFGIHG